MNQDEMSRLESANPTGDRAAPPPGLFRSITAEPRPGSITVGSRAPRRNRGWRIAIAILAVFTIGSGVSWAATGEFPGRLIFGHELGEGLTAGERDSTSGGFSVLHQADEHSISTLSERTLLMLQSLRVELVLPPAGPIPEDYERHFELEPAMITAIGEAHTNPSGAVSVIAIDGQICSFWIDLRLGNCDSPGEIERHGQISTVGFGPGGAPMALGLVDDRVATIKIEGSELPSVPVVDNVFEITNLPDGPLTILGLDESGNELIRKEMP